MTLDFYYDVVCPFAYLASTQVEALAAELSLAPDRWHGQAVDLTDADKTSEAIDALVAGLGRAEYLARWAFWNLGIPPLLTVTGKGVWVTGTFLADDVYCQTMAVETNAEGMDQVEPVMRRVCGPNLHIQRIYVPTYDYFDRRTGTSAHTDMVIAPLDNFDDLELDAGRCDLKDRRSGRAVAPGLSAQHAAGRIDRFEKGEGKPLLALAEEIKRETARLLQDMAGA